MVLEEVFKRLNKEGIEVILDNQHTEGPYCRFFTNITKTNFQTGEQEFVQEYLEVGRGLLDEKVIVEYFGDRTRVTFMTLDSHSMLQTLKDLRLSNSHNNLGESIFKRCKYHFECAHEKSEETFGISYEVYSGKERHFVFVLNRLLDLYKESNFMQPQS